MKLYLRLLFIPLLLLVSCFPVQRLAEDFAGIKDDKKILIIPPSKIFFTYYPYDPGKHENQRNDTVYDLGQSKFLKQIDDSLLYGLFMEGVVEGVEQYGIDVYLSDSVDAFLRQEGEAYVFTVAQVEVLEYLDTFTDKAVYDEVLYYQDFERINVVKYTWFEFTEYNNSERRMEVLFSMQYTGDYFDGGFRMNWLTGEVTYQYTPYSIDINDTYDLSYFSGLKNGEYIVDYLFNLFLAEKLGEDNVDHYYRYDPQNNSAQRANDDRFIIMEP